MNLTGKKIVAAAAFLVAGAGVAAAYPATVTTNLNVRSGPGTNYAVIDSLPAGSVVDIAGCSGSWCEIAGTGWSSAAYLARSGGPSVTYVQPAAPAVSFYIGSDPYYWDDDGYYWYYREGRRHRINRDFFDNRRDIRWRSDRDRRRWENWREVRRDDRREWRQDRRDDRREWREDRRDDRRDRRESRRDDDRSDRQRVRELREELRDRSSNNSREIRRNSMAGEGRSSRSDSRVSDRLN